MRGEKDGPKYDNTGLLAHNMQNSGHSIRERVVLFGIEAGGFFYNLLVENCCCSPDMG